MKKSYENASKIIINQIGKTHIIDVINYFERVDTLLSDEQKAKMEKLNNVNFETYLDDGIKPELLLLVVESLYLSTKHALSKMNIQTK